jgi:hypothetical protein
VRLRRRHRFYRHLLLTTLLVMVSLALPAGLRLLSAVGYNLAVLLLVFELEGRHRHGGGTLPLDRPYRLLGLAALAAQWFWFLTPVANRESGWPLLVLTTVFIGWSQVRLVGFLAEERQVNGRVLMGAVAGYLLLGLTAGLLFLVLETIQPGSFSSQHDPAGLLPRNLGSAGGAERIWHLDFARLNYFAFVSLTTVGYGDVLPTTPLAQMSAITFSVIGPIYMAVVMGLLIGRYASQQARLDRLEERERIERSEANDSAATDVP